MKKINTHKINEKRPYDATGCATSSVNVGKMPLQVAS